MTPQKDTQITKIILEIDKSCPNLKVEIPPFRDYIFENSRSLAGDMVKVNFLYSEKPVPCPDGGAKVAFHFNS
jgi:hypothetical protein